VLATACCVPESALVPSYIHLPFLAQLLAAKPIPEHNHRMFLIAIKRVSLGRFLQ